MLHAFDDVIPRTILGPKKVQSFFSILGEEEEVFGTYLRVVLFVYVFPPLPENQPPIPYPPPNASFVMVAGEVPLPERDPVSVCQLVMECLNVRMSTCSPSFVMRIRVKHKNQERDR